MPFDVAVLQVSAVSPASYAVFEQTCRDNAERLAATIDALMRGPGPGPRLIVVGAQPLSGGSATARAGWSDPPPIDAVAVDLEGPAFDPVTEVCARHGCYVGTSVFERTRYLPGRYFHTGFIIGPTGVVLRSPKVQARSAPEVTSVGDIAEEYREVFGPDSICPVLDTPFGRLACVVEKEIYAPEVGRLLAARKVDVVLHPSAAWVTRHPGAGVAPPPPPDREIRTMTAFTNGFHLLTAHESRVFYGTEARWSSATSTIIDPAGRELAAIGPRSEGAAIATVDLESARQTAAAQAARWTDVTGPLLDELDRVGQPTVRRS